MTNPPPLPAPTPAPLLPRRGWWSRNWLWFVPTGCLTLLALAAGFVLIIVLVVFGAMRSSDVYKHALATAKQSAAVTEALGTPIKEGLWLSGSTHVANSSGDADIVVPISGPKASGKIYAVATKSAGRWKYSTLEVEVAGSSERIDLLVPGDE